VDRSVSFDDIAGATTRLAELQERARAGRERREAEVASKTDKPTGARGTFNAAMAYGLVGPSKEDKVVESLGTAVAVLREINEGIAGLEGAVFA
jgi:hypothetical protein